MKTFKFANNNEKLNNILSYALSGIVRDDLFRFEMPMPSNLDLLYEHRGLGYEDEVEFYFLPHGGGVKDVIVDFVVITDLLYNPGDAGLYSYSEFAHGLYAELMRQSEGDTLLRGRALEFIQRYGLQKYAG